MRQCDALSFVNDCGVVIELEEGSFCLLHTDDLASAGQSTHSRSVFKLGFYR